MMLWLGLLSRLVQEVDPSCVNIHLCKGAARLSWDAEQVKE